MSIDYEIFEGKSLSSLFKDIYENTQFNRKQLDVLTKELVQFIKDGDTAVQIVPMIKEYLEINVKNDDQLVKMAGIVQRLISAEGKAGMAAMNVSEEFTFINFNPNYKLRFVDQLKPLFALNGYSNFLKETQYGAHRNASVKIIKDNL